MNRLAMKIRFLSAIVFGVALTLSAFSQDANPASVADVAGGVV